MKTKSLISQRAFDSRMEKMGYQQTPTGGGCCGYAKYVSMFGKTFRVLYTSFGDMPQVDDDEHLACQIFSYDGDGWNLCFSDAKCLLKFAEKVEEHMEKAWSLMDELQRWNDTTRVDEDFL